MARPTHTRDAATRGVGHSDGDLTDTERNRDTALIRETAYYEGSQRIRGIGRDNESRTIIRDILSGHGMIREHSAVSGRHDEDRSRINSGTIREFGGAVTRTHSIVEWASRCGPQYRPRSRCQTELG